MRSIGYGARRRKESYAPFTRHAFFATLTLAALSILSVHAQADDFNGNASGVFSNAIPDGATPDITYSSPNGPNSEITYGTAATSIDPTATRNSITIGANPFGGDFNQEFLITGLDYHNGTTFLGTNITGVTLTERLNFTNPAGLVGQKNFTFDLRTVSTPNTTGTQTGDADYLELVSNSSAETFMVGNTTYRLQITRFAPDQFSFVDPSFPHRFYVYEGETGHASIYGRLEADTPAVSSVPEPVFYQMSALLVLGGVGLVRRRRRN